MTETVIITTNTDSSTNTTRLTDSNSMEVESTITGINMSTVASQMRESMTLTTDIETEESSNVLGVVTQRATLIM